MQKVHEYCICKALDEKTRFFGLTLDEFVPIVIVLLMGFVFKQLLLALIAVAILWAALRRRIQL